MIHLDRLVTVAGVFADGNTTWTLPYAVPMVDTSEGVLQAVMADEGHSEYQYGDVLPTVRPSTTTISVLGEDLSGYDVKIGLQYAFEYELSRIFLRKDKTNAAAVADPRGKLQLRTLDVQCADAGHLDVVVQGAEREPVTYSFVRKGEGSFRVPVMSNNEQVTIRFINDSPLGLRISRVAWEGYWHSRNRTR